MLRKLFLTSALTLAFVPSAFAVSSTCNEDEPCWSWSTMGNLARGTVTVNGTARIVSVCEFQRLNRAGLLDVRPRAHSNVYRHMKGDAYALRADCKGIAARLTNRRQLTLTQ